jgi:hypothetical protein
LSFDHVWPHLRALRSHVKTDDRVEWRVLYPFRARPLLLPNGEASRARAALEVFVGNPLLRWVGHLLLGLDNLLPWHILPRVKLNEFPLGVLFGPHSAERALCAVQCGSPGPFSKLSVFCPADEVEPAKVAKIALEASADRSVHREAYWLRTLGSSGAAAPFLPQLLTHGVLPCGRAFITLSFLPGNASSSRFGRLHREFLAVLAGLTPKTSHWFAGSAVHRLRQRSDALAALLTPGRRASFAAALDDIRRGLGRRSIPACLVHGDFAAWNVRIAEQRLYVFDWEYAEANGNPLQDFVHFHLIARAIRRGSVGAGWMRNLLRRAAVHADQIFGPDSGVAEAAGPLALHYLLETVVFYVEASGYLDLNHPVIRAYLGLLDERAQWLPQDAHGEEMPHA